MEKSPASPSSHCFNCGAPVAGKFCDNCGQRVRDNADRSLGRLLGEVFNNIFFFDNRFFLSLWYLLRFPGRMTVEFLSGKRKKFISPVTLFLFMNLIYFFVSPLTDYSLGYYDQVYHQPYSQWTKGWVDRKLQESGGDEQAYSVIYQNASDNVSKSIMIINVPMIALFVFLMVLRRRQFYFDSLIFAFHFFSLFMLSWVISAWVGQFLALFSAGEESVIFTVNFRLFTSVVPLLYAILSIKKFMNLRWYWAIPAGIWAWLSVNLVNLIYRLIILLATLWVT